MVVLQGKNDTITLEENTTNFVESLKGKTTKNTAGYWYDDFEDDSEDDSESVQSADDLEAADCAYDSDATEASKCRGLMIDLGDLVF